LPYLLLNEGSTNFQILGLFLFGITLAATLLWSLIPRRDKFVAPGMPLSRSERRRLFAELDDIAASLNEEMPREVYLVPDANAFVVDRGGVMGFGSHRVMGLGLPLFSVLTVSQFRALLAHELAHDYGGDTSLGPWAYPDQDGDHADLPKRRISRQIHADCDHEGYASCRLRDPAGVR